MEFPIFLEFLIFMEFLSFLYFFTPFFLQTQPIFDTDYSRRCLIDSPALPVVGSRRIHQLVDISPEMKSRNVYIKE